MGRNNRFLAPGKKSTKLSKMQSHIHQSSLRSTLSVKTTEARPLPLSRNKLKSVCQEKKNTTKPKCCSRNTIQGIFAYTFVAPFKLDYFDNLDSLWLLQRDNSQSETIPQKQIFHLILYLHNLLDDGGISKQEIISNLKIIYLLYESTQTNSSATVTLVLTVSKELCRTRRRTGSLISLPLILEYVDVE